MSWKNPMRPSKEVLEHRAKVAEQDRQWREQGWQESGADPDERHGWGLDEQPTGDEG